MLLLLTGSLNSVTNEWCVALCYFQLRNSSLIVPRAAAYLVESGILRIHLLLCTFFFIPRVDSRSIVLSY